MNLIEELFISNSYSEAYKSIGFPVLVHKSTVIKDKFNQIKVSTIPASRVIYGVFAAEKVRDVDLVNDDLREGNAERKAVFKFIKRDLIDVGIAVLQTGDILEITLDEVPVKYLITSFSDKNELPNIFVRPVATLLSDVNVGEYNG